MKLIEAVPYHISNHIEKGLVQKHGTKTYGPGTFGIEIEFTPQNSGTDDLAGLILSTVDDSDLEHIVSKNGDHRKFDSDYSDWVMIQRKNSNIRSYRNGWDDSFGPPDDSEWLELHPEPEISRDEENNITDDYRQWKSDRDDSSYAYNRWERHNTESYREQFVKDLGADIFMYISEDSMLEVLRRGYERRYPSLMDQTKATAEENIKEVVTFLKNWQQKVDTQSSEHYWNVGMDGDNVEIRSKHLKMDDFHFVEKLFSFLDNQGYDMNPSTSAHVHVGLPRDFDMFSLLAMMSLVDEKKVKTAVGKRNLEDWAKLRDAFEYKVAVRFNEVMKERGMKSIRFSEDKLEEFLKEVSQKHSGTNIASFWKYHTIEFRYFGSNISDIKEFLTWIRYFMILPVIAKGRKQVKFGDVYFTKQDDGTILASLDKHVKAEPIQGKYLDKMKAKSKVQEPIKI